MVISESIQRKAHPRRVSVFGWSVGLGLEFIVIKAWVDFPFFKSHERCVFLCRRILLAYLIALMDVLSKKRFDLRQHPSEAAAREVHILGLPAEGNDCFPVGRCNLMHLRVGY